MKKDPKVNTGAYFREHTPYRKVCRPDFKGRLSQIGQYQRMLSSEGWRSQSEPMSRRCTAGFSMPQGGGRRGCSRFIEGGISCLELFLRL